MNQNKWDERFLGLARFISAWSKDPSTQVGAVITDKNNRLISVGFNGFARGVCDTAERLENRDVKYKMIIHAESNALLFARQDLRDTTLFVWPFMPCAACAAKVIQAGITRVVAPETPPSLQERWSTDLSLTRETFEEAGVELSIVST